MMIIDLGKRSTVDKEYENFNSYKDFPKCGEIWMAYIPKKEGVESHAQYGIRPVIIAGNNKGNYYDSEVQVYPFTSNINKGHKLPTHVLIKPDEDNGLTRDSLLMLENPDRIPKTCLKYKMGIINNSLIMEKIKEAITISIGLLALA